MAERGITRRFAPRPFGAAGMSHEEILSDYPELTEADIRACLSYAADRERGVLTAA